MGKFKELSHNKTKNPASLDSPPAAGRLCDILLFRRSAILAERFCVMGKFKELSHNTKKADESSASEKVNILHIFGFVLSSAFFIHSPESVFFICSVLLPERLTDINLPYTFGVLLQELSRVIPFVQLV